MDAKTYLAERVDTQIAWLSQASLRHKKAFVRYRLVGILLGALIAILSPYAAQAGPLKGWIPPLLQLSGAGVAVIGAVLALNRHPENWRRYRTLKEALEREKMLFLTASSDDYAGPGGFQCFVRRAEAIMAGERELWSRQSQPLAGEERSAEGLAAVPSGFGTGGPQLVPGDRGGTSRLSA